MAKIVIDGVTYDVNPDNNLLQECLSQGLDLPYFCWHPCMGSVGACRQCAVKQYRDADDKEGMLVMACMTPASEGSIISIEDEQAKSLRASVIESLMISHPHDCPVCEEGGECHLQDMTLMSGHNYRRYDKKKVTHNNQYLGPFINHEMNRCITCYRCVRYYDDYAGGTDLSAQASHHHVYFGRHEEGVLESEFSGNLVEVCPTGVFTDKAFSEHYTRKWDLQTAPSICTGCSVGCNITPGERYGTLRRVVNRYNSEVNGYFLCDRGRFGFEYVNNTDRLRDAVKQGGGSSEKLSTEQVATVIDEFKSASTIGFGSPRASNESNFALRCLVGEENFYAGYSDSEHEATQLIVQLAKDKAFNSPSIREIEKADAILILGEDVTNVAPRIALALRQSVRNKARELASASRIPQWQDAAVRELAQHERSPLSILSTYVSRLDDVASDKVIDTLPNLASMAFALANAISDKSPNSTSPADEYKGVIAKIAEQLQKAKRPLIIAGSTSGNLDLIKAAANIARGLNQQRSEPIDLCLLVPEVNSIGMGLLVNADNSLQAGLARLDGGSATRAIVLENDLFRRAPKTVVDNALTKAEKVLVLDQFSTATSDKADYLFPATAFSEHEATYINYEGRAQLSFQVHQCATGAMPSWRWFGEATDIESLINRCTNEAQGFDKLARLLPDKGSFIAGMKIPRQSHRYSGRTAMRANLSVHEPKQPQDDESVMSFSMEGISSQKDASLMASAWAPRWNSNQSISKFQDEVNGELKQAHPGSLLIERDIETSSYFEPSSNAESSENGLHVSLAYQIFGSDELSARSSSIQQRMTDPYIGLSPDDAEAKGFKHGDSVSLGATDSTAIVCIRTSIKPGSVVIYCGNSEINAAELPSQIEISLNEQAEVLRGIKGLIVSDLLEEEY
ncbi:MAG: NADH-quinone oxidoreductase subunit G [SAR86 cluster bacterium]|uniref:NADH-quinone oxidoreductase n=1 Tax=SAR86 cluster bacterium TaxID=2030880 RepID=A0A2A5BBZ2_9GAMM|nr:MAG: NADH-quinone oxidoreductase subunit G [SAR86 cluster bacterium]